MSGGANDVDLYNGYFDSYYRHNSDHVSNSVSSQLVGDNYSIVAHAVHRPGIICYDNENVLHVFTRLVGALFDPSSDEKVYDIKPMTFSINNNKMAVFGAATYSRRELLTGEAAEDRNSGASLSSGDDTREIIINHGPTTKTDVTSPKLPPRGSLKGPNSSGKNADKRVSVISPLSSTPASNSRISAPSRDSADPQVMQQIVTKPTPTGINSNRGSINAPLSAIRSIKRRMSVAPATLGDNNTNLSHNLQQSYPTFTTNDEAGSFNFNEVAHHKLASFAWKGMYESINREVGGASGFSQSSSGSSKFKSLFLPAMAEKFNFDLDTDMDLVAEIVKCVGGDDMADALVQDMAGATSGDDSVASILQDVENASSLHSTLDLSEMSKKGGTGGGVRIRILRRLCDLCGISLSRGTVERVTVLASLNNLSGVFMTMGRTDYLSHVENVDRDDDYAIEYVASRRMPLRAQYSCRKGDLEMALTEVRKALHTRKLLDGNKSFLYLDGMLDVGVLLLEAATSMTGDDGSANRLADNKRNNVKNKYSKNRGQQLGFGGERESEDEWDTVNADEVRTLQSNEYFEVAMSLFVRAIREMVDASAQDLQAITVYINQLHKRNTTLAMVRHATTVDLTGQATTPVALAGNGGGGQQPNPVSNIFGFSLNDGSILRKLFGADYGAQDLRRRSGVGGRPGRLTSATQGTLAEGNNKSTTLLPQNALIDPKTFVPLFFAKQIITVKILQGRLRLAQTNLEDAKMYFDDAAADARNLPSISQVAASHLMLKTLDAQVDFVQKVIELGGVITCTGDTTLNVLSPRGQGMLGGVGMFRRSTAFGSAFTPEHNIAFGSDDDVAGGMFPHIINSGNSTIHSGASGDARLVLDILGIVTNAQNVLLRLKPSVFTHALLERLSGVLIFAAAMGESADVLRDLVDQSRTIFGGNSVELASALNMLAFVYSKINIEEFGEECESVMKESMSIIELVHGLFSVEHLTAINNYGTMLISRKKYMQASRLFNQALLATASKEPHQGGRKGRGWWSK
jgi:hypothetical protein